MWKKTFLALLVLSQYALAETPPTKDTGKSEETAQAIENSASIQLSAEQLSQYKSDWLAEQQIRLIDRENFLQLESVINSAIKQKNVSPNLLTFIENIAKQQLISADYPLKEEIEWLTLRAKIAMVDKDNLTNLIRDIQSFSQKYPNTAKRNKLAQLPFRLYAEQQQSAALLKFAEQTAPVGLENQCRVFTARSEQIAQQLNSENADMAKIDQDKLLQEFDLFWQKANTALPRECNPINEWWQKSDFNNDRKTKLKAVALFNANSRELFTELVKTHSETLLATWLNAVEQVLLSPEHLSNFAENQPLDHWNKSVVLKAFPTFIKSQPEEIDQAHWQTYLAWAEKFQLSDDEKRQWLITFLNRAFDNPNAEFQQWRDEQISQLDVDNLIERRIRMAIWQKTDLATWLAKLSPDAKNKQEWRYWTAKSQQEKGTVELEKLSLERGFYPMLAAHTLGKTYRFDFPKTTPLTTVQQQKYQKALDRIAELRALKREDRAKLAWNDLLQAVSFDEKLALTHYAYQQNWFDLAVEGTIQAKAWDYINLRLPNAYSTWFDLNLAGKNIRKSFAMAIARQESAWNATAKSHANALGLMQMLPSTAQKTAENSGFPFAGDDDLLQPFRNIMLGTAHLEELNEKYPNNRILMASAYNAGTHRVEKWLTRSNGKLAMDEFIASIPFYETRGYVQNVLAYDFYYQMLQHTDPLIMFTQEEQRIY